MPDIIDLVSRIQQIPSPSFHERERAQFVADLVREWGATPDVCSHSYGEHQAVNTYLRLPGRDRSAPALLISAHTDTVFPGSTSLALTRTTDRLAGPGVGDNSLAVAALLVLAHDWIAAPPPPCDLWFLANAGEEGIGDLAGMRTAIEHIREEQHSGIGAALVLEGMLLGGVYHAGIGVRRFSVRISGPGGHSWGDHGTESAVHALVSRLARVAALPVPKDPRSSLNVGTIKGGTSVNTIAAAAGAEIDVRSVDQRTVDRFAGEVVKALESDPLPAGLSLDVVTLGSRPAGEIPAAHPLVRAAVQSLVDVDVSPSLKRGSTDANALLAAGIPSVCVGITTGGGAHTAAEYIDLPPIERGMDQLRRLIPRAAQIAASGGNNEV